MCIRDSGEPEVLKVEQPTAITLQLPSGFVTAGETVYIKHQATEENTYFYKAIAGAQGEISFTSYHGFSPFTFSLVNEAVAEIGEIGYDSLQAAVDAAQTGDVITLLQDNAEEVTVRRTVSFTLQKADGVTFTGSIKAGSNTTAGKDNGTDLSLIHI